MSAAANKRRALSGNDDGAGSFGRRLRSTLSSCGPSQKGSRFPVARSGTQATVPCKANPESKSLCDAISFWNLSRTEQKAFGIQVKRLSIFLKAQ